MAKHYPNLDLVFTALGDPTRRAVVARLARGPASVSELASAHDMALPSFLGHLRKLERAGMIRTSKTGRVRTCELNAGALGPAQGWLDVQRALWQARLDQFEEHVTSLLKATAHGSRSQN